MIRRLISTERVDVPGPAGALETLIEVPEEVLPAVLIACHPHPQHGGTMDNKVVHTLARAFYRLGAVAVRFNYRGVGKSEGRYDGGAGELEDALAVASWIREEYPDTSLFLAGFSFGAKVALEAAAPLRPRRLVTVALPVERLSESTQLPACPWLAVHAAADEIVPLEKVLAWHAGVGERASLVVIDGATHFFHGKLNELAEHVTRFIAPDFARERLLTVTRVGDA